MLADSPHRSLVLIEGPTMMSMPDVHPHAIQTAYASRHREGGDAPRVRQAAELKASHTIAYADAFAVATALEFRATLLTGDPEIKPLEGEQDLEVQWLPRRS